MWAKSSRKGKNLKYLFENVLNINTNAYEKQITKRAG